MSSPNGDITRLLAAMKKGDSAAESQLIALVNTDLHSLARRYMSRERSDHTLQPTALVNEAYMRLMRKEALSPQDRIHFFATAATIMRRVLVDHARERHALKRGGDANKVEFENFMASAAPPLDQWLILDEALNRLAEADPRAAKFIELHFFGGLTIEEAAKELKIASRTVKRDWEAARAWLKKELRKGAGAAAPPKKTTAKKKIAGTSQ